MSELCVKCTHPKEWHSEKTGKCRDACHCDGFELWEGMKETTTVRITKETRAALKVRCAMMNVTMLHAIEQAISQWFDHYAPSVEDKAKLHAMGLD